MTITRWNGTNGFNGCHGEQGSRQESHGRSAGSAGASMLQTPTRTGRLLSIRGAHTWQLSLLDLSQAMKSLQLCQPQASENGPDTTERAPLDARVWGAVRVPGSTRHQDARMSLVFVSGSDWPPAPARFNAPRGGLRAAGICNQFVAAQVEETEPRSAAGLWPGRRCSVDAGGGSRAAETRAAGETGSDEPRCT